MKESDTKIKNDFTKSFDSMNTKNSRNLSEDWLVLSRVIKFLI